MLALASLIALSTHTVGVETGDSRGCGKRGDMNAYKSAKKAPIVIILVAAVYATTASNQHPDFFAGGNLPWPKTSMGCVLLNKTRKRTQRNQKMDVRKTSCDSALLQYVLQSAVNFFEKRTHPWPKRHCARLHLMKYGNSNDAAKKGPTAKLWSAELITTRLSNQP